jgi:tetratricopeptide (TPR) repeat protein
MIRRQTIQAQNVLAIIFYKSGLIEKSLDLFESVLWECKELYGTFHSVTWLVFNNLDVNLSELGRHAERQVILENIKPEAEREFDHEENARSALRWLADAKTKGNNLGKFVAFKEAELLYARVLTLQRESRGKDDFAVGRIWSALSKLYQNWGREEMDICGLEWLRICRLHQGEQHADTGWAYIDLAGIYQQLGNYTEAIPMFKKAIEILPNYNNNYAKLCFDLSKALHAKQDQEAIYFGRKALDVDISINGRYQVCTAEDNYALGIYLRDHQIWQDARECFEEALNISGQISNLYYESRALEGLKNIFADLGDSDGY